MKSDPYNVDDLLKKLADYQPSAEPDWESFYADYQKNVGSREISMGKVIDNEPISIAVKSTIIVFVVFTVAVSSYFLFFRNQSLNEENETIPLIESQTITTKEAAHPGINEMIKTEKHTVSKKQTKPEATSDHNISQKHDFEARKEKIPVLDSSNKLADDAITFDSIHEDSQNGLTPASATDSLSQNQVIIKKTVIISDTLRIKHKAPKR